MKEIILESQLINIAPKMIIGVISASVENTIKLDALDKSFEELIDEIENSFTLETVKFQPEVFATREVYKQLGKDPNRYRPSADALLRRVSKKMPLNRISILVDIINMVSIKTGFSIGGFDYDKINGTIKQGIGLLNEPFEAIGRGEINIENMPVYHDEIGPIGTPTSDHVRTSISLDTKKILIIINGYSGNIENIDLAIHYCRQLLLIHANGKDIQIKKYGNLSLES